MAQSVSVAIICKIENGLPLASLQKCVRPPLPVEVWHDYVKENKLFSEILTLPHERFAGDYRGKHYALTHNTNPLPVA